MKRIPLTRGHFATIDDCDYELISKHTWHVHIDWDGKKYAKTNIKVAGKYKSITMHRLILWHASEHTDHKDGDGLNNTRSNIRPATRFQNAQNRLVSKHSSKYKGVTHYKWGSYRFGPKTYLAQIYKTGQDGIKRRYHLGYFQDPALAAKAYDEMAAKLFGEFAKTNAQMGLL